MPHPAQSPSSMQRFQSKHHPSFETSRSRVARFPTTSLGGVLTCTTALLFAGCSSGGDGPAGATATGLTKTLQELGVSTAMTQRQGIDGMSVADDYSPFGDTWELSKTSELLIVGTEVDSTGERFTLLDLTDDNGGATEEVLFSLSATDESWISGPSNTSSFHLKNNRDVVAADIDADGLEEIVVLYLNGGEVRLKTIQDETDGFVETDMQLTFVAGIEDVVMRSARLDGDRRDDLVIALSSDQSMGQVLFVRTDESGFTEFGTRRTFEPTLTSPNLTMEVSVGNVDMDKMDEVAIVLNENFGTTNDPDGVSRLTILDDAVADFATLRDLESANGTEANGTPRRGLSATPLLVDVDGDDRCELILATRTDFNSSCDADGYFFMAFEDEYTGGASLGTTYFTHRFSSCDSPMKPRVRALFANALDVDGDGFDEFHINQFVFDDFANSSPWTMDLSYQLPDDLIWSQNDFGAFAQGSASIVTGEFTGDDRDDIAAYRADGRELHVWGREAPDTSMSIKRTIDTDFQNSQTATFPILLPVNVDRDSPVLSYSEAEYAYVFTEPVVLAALAAAPCRSGIGQNLAECYTAFGNTTSTSTETERTVSVNAKATIGISLSGGVTQSSVELTGSATVEANTITNSLYREERTVLYRTGVAEDTVIFTTIPVDQYTYTIESHPDATLIGEKIVVNLPRDPITLQADRVAYNNSVQEGSLLIANDILTHTIGDPSSYPDRQVKNSLLSQHGGLQFGPQAVGIGSGSTSLTLQVGNAWGEGGSLELGFEIDAETTNGGLLLGLSFGASESNSVVVTSGSETTYQASVGSIDAANHSSAGYSFGLFTYVERDPVTGQDYEVVQYWVE